MTTVDDSSDDAAEHRSRVALRLLVDHTTAETAAALHDAGVRPLLLKGPVIARWLYAEAPSARGYSDVDFLVAPECFDRAEEVLRSLGFTATPTVRLGGERLIHAVLYERPGAAQVDLHRTLHDLEDVDPSLVWAAALREHETLIVGGVEIDVPGVLARCLHVVFHVSLEDSPAARAVMDLRRAIEQVDRDTWRRAADLAKELGVEAMMAAKLRLVPGGEGLALSIGLSDRSFPARLLTTREEDSPPYVHSLSRFAELPSMRLRLRYLRAKAIPSRSFMRQWTPVARSGPVGLAAAYLLRISWVLISLPVSPVFWWVARRKARRAAAARAVS